MSSGSVDLGATFGGSGGGGGGGVSTLNTLSGDLTLVPGTGIDILAAGSTITISSLPITSSPSTLAGFDAMGVLESIPSWIIDINTGGLDYAPTLTPDNPGGGSTYYINNFQAQITPIADLTNLNFIGLQNYAALNGPFSFNDYTAVYNSIEAFGLGNKNNLVNLQQALNIGDSTNVTVTNSVSGFRNEISVRANATITQDVVAIQQNITLDTDSAVTGSLLSMDSSMDVNAQVAGGFRLASYNANINVDQPSGVGLNAVSSNINLDGNLSYYTGFFANLQMTSGTMANSINPFQDNTRIQPGAAGNSLVSFAAYPQTDAGSSLLGGYTGININPNLMGDMTNTGVTGYGFFPQIEGVTMNYISAIGMNIQVKTGTTVVNSIDMMDLNTQVASGASVNSITTVGSFPTLSAGSTVHHYSGIQISPNIDTPLDSLSFASFGTGGPTASITNAQGIQVNMNNVVSPNQLVGISLNGCSISANGVYDTGITPLPPGVFGVNGLGGTIHIASGFPINDGSFGFGNNLGLQIQAEDDMGPDSTGFDLGLSVNGFVNQIEVAAGKSLSTINYMAAGGGVGAGSGAITNANFFRALGFLPEGGTLAVTNMIGFKADALMDVIGATNLWGVYVEATTADNYFAKSLNVGSTSKKVTNADVGIEIGNKKAFLPGSLTTTEKLALTPVAGMVVFDNTLSQLSYYNGTIWINV